MAEGVREGQNLPRFQALQLDFAAHIRNPDRNPIPAGIEKRRMDIYNRLFYNNIESFCANRFPRAKSILGDSHWHGMIRDFIHRHQSRSPYFSQISEEFITYLAIERNSETDPPFLIELCHFEWLPMYLDRLAGEIPMCEACVDPLQETLQASEFVVVRRYTWCVNELDSRDTNSNPPSTPTWILAYRDRSDKVYVKKTDEFTAKIIEVLRSPNTGRQAVAKILASDVELNSERQTQISSKLLDLVNSDVLLTTAA